MPKLNQIKPDNLVMREHALKHVSKMVILKAEHEWPETDFLAYLVVEMQMIFSGNLKNNAVYYFASYMPKCDDTP